MVFLTSVEKPCFYTTYTTSNIPLQLCSKNLYFGRQMSGSFSPQSRFQRHLTQIYVGKAFNAGNFVR